MKKIYAFFNTTKSYCKQIILLMTKYARDPYWTTARFPSTDANGRPVRKGDRIYYYPSTKTLLSDAEAKKASAEFESAKMDEATMTGSSW